MYKIRPVSSTGEIKFVGWWFCNRSVSKKPKSYYMWYCVFSKCKLKFTGSMHIPNKIKIELFFSLNIWSIFTTLIFYFCIFIFIKGYQISFPIIKYVWFKNILQLSYQKNKGTYFGIHRHQHTFCLFKKLATRRCFSIRLEDYLLPFCCITV